jgi:hypothetical protein
MQFAMDGLVGDPRTCSGRPAIQGKISGKSAAESIDRLLWKKLFSDTPLQDRDPDPGPDPAIGGDGRSLEHAA